ADVSGDGLPDVVFGTSGGLLEALSGLDGSLLWSVNLAADYGDTRFELDHAPVIADLDGDGSLDAFIVGGHTEYPDYSGNFGRAYAISLGRGSGPEWRMFQRDPQRRSSLCGEEITGISVLADNRPAPLTLYPTPVSEFLTVEGLNVRGIRIVDAAGRIVLSLPAAGETTRFDLGGLRPGSYYLVATGDGTASVRAFIKR
ncbi:MAG: T9SS type A sorting domain-containing protein, partial [Gemmatimonadetes bacterium]|nr:T9SS type A sorting domain-containing protein [Gemmatimonadota bacterium]